MTNEEFAVELKQMVLRRAMNEHLVDSLALVREVAERISTDPVFGDLELVDWSGVGSNNRSLKLHGFTDLDTSDNSFGLVIGDWSDEDNIESVSQSESDRYFLSMLGFVNDSIKAKLKENIVKSNSAYEAYITINQLKNKLTRIRLHLITNKIVGSRYKFKDSENVGDILIEYHLWDLSRLKSIYESNRERESISINFSDFTSTGIPFIKATDMDGIRSFLCVIEGNLLADVFEKYGSRLLEGNVRSFLGMKGGVNQGIRNTVKNHPDLFFVYNNGIAATASEVNIKITEGSDKIVSISDLQIVNGGQTTSSLLNARKKDKLSLNNIFVQLKLSEVSHDAAANLIPKIAEYSNTQNKISGSDFFSNHPFHQKMQIISRRLLAPTKTGARNNSKWYYERSRGQYQNERLYLNDGARNLLDTEFPFNQLINKTDLAKYDSSFREKPYWTSLGGDSNFIKFASHFTNKTSLSDAEYWKSIENNYDENYFKKIICLAIIWKKLEKLISDARGDWYEGDYRAQIVTYTVSSLFYIIRNRGGTFNFKNIWESQSIDQKFEKIIEQIAIIVQTSLLNPPQGISNVGQWCKKDKCWEVVSALNFNNIAIPDEYLIPKHGASELSQNDNMDTNTDISKLTNIQYWVQLLKWENASTYLNVKDLELLKLLSSFNNMTDFPDSFDFALALKLKGKAEAFGFEFNGL